MSILDNRKTKQQLENAGEDRDTVDSTADVEEIDLVETITPDLEEKTPVREDTIDDADLTDIEESTTPSRAEAVEKLYEDSSREATELYFKNQKLSKAISEAQSVGEISVDELREYALKMGEDYDTLDKFAQNILKNSLVNEKRFKKITDAVKEDEKFTDWMRKVDAFVENDDTLNRYPSLENNREDFRKFASRPNRIGLDLDDVVALFLYNKTTRTTKSSGVSNNELLLSSKGKAPSEQKKTGLSGEDLFKLRSMDQRAYKLAIKSKKLST